MADIEETFIQMLGRKRIKNSNEISKLYILKRNITYFKNKIENVKTILKFYNNNKYNYEILNCNNYSDFILQQPDKYTIDLLQSVQSNMEEKGVETLTNNLSMDLLLSPYMFHKYGFIKNPNIQQRLLSDLLKNESIHKKLLYSYFGILEFNSFSIQYYKCNLY